MMSTDRGVCTAAPAAACGYFPFDGAPVAGDVEPVVALHCSGTNSGQWRQLAAALDAPFKLFAPEHYGCDAVGPWPGLHAFTLADEAARTIALIDRCARPVHVVGHSYGGGVALHVALARPGRVASLSLYEPSAFNLLPHLGPAGAAAFEEISDLVARTGSDVATGNYRAAAARFVDYWGGPNAWSSTRESVRAALTRWMPKAPLDFSALIREPASIEAYAELHIPTSIVRGEHAPAPTRAIAESLTSILPDAALDVVDGAGHMGPLTHPTQVNALILRHVTAASSSSNERLQSMLMRSGASRILDIWSLLPRRADAGKRKRTDF